MESNPACRESTGFFSFSFDSLALGISFQYPANQSNHVLQRDGATSVVRTQINQEELAIHVVLETAYVDYDVANVLLDDGTMGSRSAHDSDLQLVGIRQGLLGSKSTRKIIISVFRHACLYSCHVYATTANVLNNVKEDLGPKLAVMTLER